MLYKQSLTRDEQEKKLSILEEKHMFWNASSFKNRKPTGVFLYILNSFRLEELVSRSCFRRYTLEKSNRFSNFALGPVSF